MATRGLSWQLLSQRRIRPLSPRPLTRRHFFGAISVTGATTEGCETSDQVLRQFYCCQPRFQSIGQHHQNRFCSLAKFGFRRFGSSCLSICTRMSVVSSFLQICFQQNDYTTSRLYCQTPFCTLASTEAIKQLYELK